MKLISFILPIIDQPTAEISDRQIMANVLIVDNEAAVRTMLEEMLRSEGHRAFSAAGASEAKATLDQHLIEVVVLDIYMPEMNGLALMKMIRETYENLETILISGRHTRDAETTAKRFGAISFLTKPFTRSDLCSAVSEAAESVRKMKTF